jgi:hypothetical protein
MRSRTILMLSLSTGAFAQTAGTITGAVLDLGGDKVAKAPIQVTNAVTKATRGITAAGALFPYEIVQTPARLVMIFEDDIPSHRTVYLDGRQHPKDPNPNWMGHSVGHWEGDTLVVDTVGFNDKSWLDPQGHPHTEKMHVTERVRRPDLGHLEIEFTIEDPGAYAKPWLIKRVADLDPDDEIGEYVCTEGERDVVHMVGK